MKHAVPLAMLILLAGCRHAAEAQRIDIGCEEAITVSDSFGAALLKYDAKAHSISKVLEISPERSVIGSPLYVCETGTFVYATAKRMAKNPKETLHVHFGNTEKAVEFLEGINGIYPLDDNTLLIKAKQGGRAPLDPSMGDLSDGETWRDPPLSGTGQFVKFRDLPAKGLHYLDDIVVDLHTLSRIKTLKGAMYPYTIHDGEFFTQAFDKTVYRVDPWTAHRQRIHDYGEQWDGRPGFPTPRGMPAGTRFHSVHGVLYAVTSRTGHEEAGRDYFETNAIFSFNDEDRSWQKLKSLDFKPQFSQHSGGKILIAGTGRAALYDTSSKTLLKADLPMGDREVSSAAALDGAWAIAVGPRDEEVNDTRIASELWIVAQDLSGVLQKIKLDGFKGMRVSTRKTPTPFP